MNPNNNSLQQLLISHKVSLIELCQQFHLDEAQMAADHASDPYGRLLTALAQRNQLPELRSYLETNYPEPMKQSQTAGVFINAQRDIELKIRGDLVGRDKITTTTTAGSGAAVTGDNSTAVGEKGAIIQDSTLTNSPTITGDYNQVIIGTQIDDIENLPPGKGESPYKGLEYFTEEDADWFFGREQATAKLINRLHDLDFLAVVGASGSGKSSLVRAGVIPVMKRKRTLTSGLEPPAGEWHVHTFTPTARPVAKLTAVQQQVQQEHNDDSDHKLLLFVDQFEELFTLCEKEDKRVEFVNNLLTLANSNDTKIIITIRADFYEECIRYEQLRELFTTNQELLGQMTMEELTAAILQPAAKGNWQFQVGLTEEILDELGNEPGRLPLLSHALYETWQARRGRVLTLSGYREAGKVQGAIAKTAETTFEQFSPRQQKIAQQIFLRLTELGDGTQDTRRRVSQTELGNDETTQTVIQHLADKRLVTTSQEGVDVAHETLIRHWPRLQAWLNVNREGLIVHRRLTLTAQDWVENNENPTLLYSGFRLIEAKHWRRESVVKLSDLEEKFFAASVSEHERPKEEERIRREREEAQASQAMMAFSTIYRPRTNSVAGSLEAEQDLFQRLFLLERSTLEPIELFNRYNSLKASFTPKFPLYWTFSGDGKWFAWGTGASRNVVLHEWQTDSEPIILGSPRNSQEIWQLAFSANGDIFASPGSLASIEIWDLENLDEPKYVLGGIMRGVVDIAQIESIAISPDSRWVIGGGVGNVVVIWDLENVNEEPIIFTVNKEKPATEIVSIQFSTSGRWFGLRDQDGKVFILENQDHEWVTIYEGGIN